VKKLKDGVDPNLQPSKEEEDEKSETDIPKNNTSILSALPSFFGGKYFKSEWSFAQFRLDDPKAICSFGPNNTIIVISSLGKYYHASFDIGKKRGDCTLLQENVLNIDDKEA
jgi:hypothetical protein